MDIFEKEIKSMLKTHIKQDIPLEKPPSADMGDYALPCFVLAKELKKAPVEIAKDLAAKLKSGKLVTKIEANGPYVNFFVSKETLSENVLMKIARQKNKYGAGASKKKKLMIEFSQANTHKAFHVGHIRGTSLGESLARILEFTGFKVIRANYQGDTGMHVAKWIWCYKKFHNKDKLKQDEAWIAGIYVDAVKRIKENPEFQEEVDEINRKLDSKEDKELNELWKKTRKLSLDALEKVYRELNTGFDKNYFESHVETKGKEISKDLVSKGIARISEESTIIDLEKYRLSVWVLLRKDGTALYSAKDLYLARKKFEDCKIEKSIYVIGAEQKLYFRQLFKTLELMKFEHSKDLKVIHFDLIRLPGGKMSSRTGNNILFSEFKKELVDYAKEEIQKRGKISKKELEERALKIAVAAMKFSMLSQDPNKVIVFDKKEAMRFEGETGPYIQYAHARICSIFRKHGREVYAANLSLLNNEHELKLIKTLRVFPQTIQEAASHYKPSIIAHYLIELAQQFNEFYHCCPILKEKKELRDARLLLISCVKQVLKNGLNLLGIEAPDEM